VATVYEKENLSALMCGIVYNGNFGNICTSIFPTDHNNNGYVDGDEEDMLVPFQA
jgi:uncharacterized membrane protein (UPF0182 family)